MVFPIPVSPGTQTILPRSVEAARNAARNCSNSCSRPTAWRVRSGLLRTGRAPSPNDCVPLSISASAASSAAAEGLASAFFSSMHMISSLSGAGISRRMLAGGVTGSEMMACNTASGASPGNGCCAVSSSYSTMPREKISVAGVRSSPLACCGDM